MAVTVVNRSSRRGMISKMRELAAQLGATGIIGNVFFVQSTQAGAVDSTTDTTRGRTPDKALATLAGAMVLCTANIGDVIVLMPGHAETIIGAAGSGITVAGVSVIGVGNGRQRPVFTFTTAAAASFDITAANVIVKNVAFVNAIDAQTAMLNVIGADVFFDGCEFETNTGTTGALIGILTAATATRLRVENCFFRGPAINSGTSTNAQIKHEVGVDYIIRNNYFCGKIAASANACILNATAVLRGLIDNNRFVVSTGTVAISMHASSTPFITNNRINVPSGVAPMICAAGFVAGNIYSAAAGVVMTGETSATSVVSRI